MATWKTNRCVAYVSEAAWEQAELRLDVPDGWRILEIQHDAPNARYVMLLDGANVEWTSEEFAGLPVIGAFGLDGDEQIGAVSAQAADLHAALLETFRRNGEAEAPGTTRETEGEPSRP